MFHERHVHDVGALLWWWNLQGIGVEADVALAHVADIPVRTTFPLAARLACGTAVIPAACCRAVGGCVCGAVARDDLAGEEA